MSDGHQEDSFFGFIALLPAAVLVYFVLYGPQPLFPRLATGLALTELQTGLLTTAAMLPLCLAPLSFGRLLSAVAPHRVLRGSLILLALATAGFALVDHFPLLLLIRFLQGLLLPLILTSVMTLTARSADPETVQRRLAVYVTATILGGFFGRLTSGVFAGWGDWRHYFYLLAILLAGAACLPFGGGTGRTSDKDRLHWRNAARVLADPVCRRVFLCVACVFFIFSAMMNFLPFRMEELRGGTSGFMISLMYTGYLPGALVSAFSAAIAGRIGGPGRTMGLSMVVFTGTTALALTGYPVFLFAVLCLFCAAMFLLHTMATTIINTRGGGQGRPGNALYLTFYYLGGVTGTFLPGLVYERFGWHAFIATLLTVGGIGLLSLRRIGGYLRAEKIPAGIRE